MYPKGYIVNPALYSKIPATVLVSERIFNLQSNIADEFLESRLLKFAGLNSEYRAPATLDRTSKDIMIASDNFETMKAKGHRSPIWGRDHRPVNQESKASGRVILLAIRRDMNRSASETEAASRP